MLPFLRRQWFLTSLTAIFVLGFTFPHWFEPFANARSIRSAILASVLFVMALPLDTRSVGRTLRHPAASLLGSAVNMGLLPLLAWGCSYLLHGDMRAGVLVTAAVPCTLASAAVWTRRAGGDDTVAILVTALTNVSCFLTTPFWLLVTTGSRLDSAMQAQLARMPIRLALLVVLPMVIAQLLRQQPSIGRWASARKSQLGIFAQLGILSMVLAGATKCGIQLTDTSWSTVAGIPPMLLVVTGLHLSVFWCGLQLARWTGFSRSRQIAVGMSGSQKTLMVGLDIAIVYFGGLAILPMVAYHFIQLTADTVIADQLRRRGESAPEGTRSLQRSHGKTDV